MFRCFGLKGIDRITEELITQHRLSRYAEATAQSDCETRSRTSSPDASSQAVTAQLQQMWPSSPSPEERLSATISIGETAHDAPEQQHNCSSSSHSPQAPSGSLQSSLHAVVHPESNAISSPSNPTDLTESAYNQAAADSSPEPSSEQRQQAAVGSLSAAANLPKQLPIATISIAGWNDSPVTVSAVLSLTLCHVYRHKASHLAAVVHMPVPHAELRLQAPQRSCSD